MALEKDVSDETISITKCCIHQGKITFTGVSASKVYDLKDLGR